MEPQVRLIEKSVIIHRNEGGFGFKVSGHNPVLVASVTENGAAWRAGVRQFDWIIKVNGTLVRTLEHNQVVKLIQECTPFVNLTLHSPETIAGEPFSLFPGLQSMEQVVAQQQAINNNHSTTNTNNNNNNSLSGSTGNLNSLNNSTSNSNVDKVQTLQQRVQQHQVANNLSWLLEIGDDLFQDSQQKLNHQQHQQQQQQQLVANISPSSNQHQDSPTTGQLQQLLPTTVHQPTVGVSKLALDNRPHTTGLLNTNTSHHLATQHPIGGGTGSTLKPKLRHQHHRNHHQDTNPYYYYKSVQDTTTSSSTNGPDINSCNSATSLLGKSQDTGATSSSKSSLGGGTLTSGLSIVRSRSGSKMSTRSTGKYRPRNLTSRLVEDFKSLTITNSQVTPSSLSTSPSSSDLSDCDDQDSSRLDCLSLDTSSSSSSSIGANSTGLKTFVGGYKCMVGSRQTVATGGPQRSSLTTRRLEIIRELVETEKTHTERLKHLNDLLYKPMKAENLVSAEQLKMVFSCHKTLFKIHRQIYKILLAAQQDVSEIYNEPLIGKALIRIFEGELGKRLEKAASTFCACQSTNTELLNRFTRKDTKAGEFLAQVANQQMLGRLGIKDLLASCFQRLTKYPLLLDNLLKATPVVACGIHSKSLSEGSIATSMAATTSQVEQPSSNMTDAIVGDGLCFKSNELPNQDEFTSSSSSTTTTITTTTTTTTNTTTTNNNNNVNTVALDPVTSNNDSTLSSTLDTSFDDTYGYERLCISRALHQSRQILIHVNEAVRKAILHYKLRELWRKYDTKPPLNKIDIDSEQILHEGPLTLRLGTKSFEVYVLLLTHCLVILTGEGPDKYKLKPFAADGAQFSPIFNIDEHLATRDTATDENGFYLLCKRKDDARIYEFASQSPADRTRWKDKIHMAQMYNFAIVPDDDNTLTRYRDLITLATSSNTPNNIEHSPTSSQQANNNNNNNNMIASSTAKSAPDTSLQGC